MDELEGAFEWFFDEMFKVVLDLLGALDVEYDCEHAAEAVHLDGRGCLLVFHLFLDEPQIAAHAAHLRVQLHAAVHLEEGVLVGPHSHVDQGRVFWSQLLAKTVEEPVVGRKFARLLVFNAEEEIDVADSFVDQSSAASQRFPFARLVLYFPAATHEFLLVHAFSFKLPLDKGAALGSERRVGVLEICAETAGGQSVGGDVGKAVSGGEVLVAFLFAGGEFLHDGLFADVDCLVAVDLLEEVLLLVDHAVQDHLQVLVVLVVLLLYVLDRPADPHHLVVLRADPVELALHAALEVLGLEEELREVEGLFFFDLLVVLVVFVLLLEGQHLVLLQEGLAFPLKLLEVFEERLVRLLNSVHHHHHEDVVGTHARTHHLVDIFGNSSQCFLERFPVFSGHADADAELAAAVRSFLLLLCLTHAHLVDEGRLRRDWFFEQRDVVVQMLAAELFERAEIVGYRPEWGEFVFVVVDSIVLEHQHESFGEGVGRYGLVVAVGA